MRTSVDYRPIKNFFKHWPMLTFLLSSGIADECSMYNSDGCTVCTTHYLDRNCGWNSRDNICENKNLTTCPDNEFYYKDNVKCGNTNFPTPTPTPWPVYEVNTSFCRALSGSWCSKCVSTNVNYSCVWCHSTRECVMGDKDGFFFGQCPDEKGVSYKDDDRCKGIISKGGIIGVRVGLGLVCALFTALGIWGCYHFIKTPAVETPKYDEIH